MLTDCELTGFTKPAKALLFSNSTPVRSVQLGTMGLSLVLFCGVIAGISGFLFGYDSGIMTTTIAQEQFLQQFKPKESMVGTIVAIMQAGGFFGCLTAGKLSDLWGRKKAIMFGCMFVVVSL